MSKTIIIDPDLEERQLENYYFQEYYCENCGRPNPPINHITVIIAKGTPRPTKLLCPNCGLEALS